MPQNVVIVWKTARRRSRRKNVQTTPPPPTQTCSCHMICIARDPNPEPQNACENKRQYQSKP
jgi:hypothetical protein